MFRLLSANMIDAASSPELDRIIAALSLYADGAKSRVRVERIPFQVALSPINVVLAPSPRTTIVSIDPMVLAASDNSGI